MSDDTLKLSRFDRYKLANQLRILEALYPDEAEDIAIQREAIEHGYELLYRWQMEHIYDGDDVMTAEECLEVWDTLDMFDVISRSMEKSGNAAHGKNFASKFVGYDGNNETKFMSFAAYTVERLKRFEYVRRERGWNSHMPVRDMYRRMLTVWRSFGSSGRGLLSESQLTEVLEAAIHPENRRKGE